MISNLYCRNYDIQMLFLKRHSRTKVVFLSIMIHLLGYQLVLLVILLYVVACFAM